MELILGMEEELAERVYYHTPSAELFRALFNTGNINLDQLCGFMKNRKNEPGASSYQAFVEYVLTQNNLRSVYANLKRKWSFSFPYMPTPFKGG